jgi:hypothetical protein
MTDKNKGGRPLKFETVKELQKKIDAYFKKCDDDEDPYSITGLALALKCERHTIVNYGKKEEFFTTVSHARLRVENCIEVGSLKGDLVPASCNFNLKNNFGWKDKTEHDLTSSDKSMSPTGINWIEDEGGE